MTPDLEALVVAACVFADENRVPTRGRQRHQLGVAHKRRSLLTPDRTRTTTNIGRERALASTRLVIEGVFANLKGQMRLERHLAKTPAGLAVRIAQRILALTIGILLNTLTGRPARRLRRPITQIEL